MTVTDPELSVMLQNTPGNFMERLYNLEVAVLELQLVESPVIEELQRDDVRVIDLDLFPAAGVTVTDPTSTNYIGGFISGEGLTFGANTWNFGGVNAGVIQVGINTIDGTLYAINANIAGVITIGAGSTAGGWVIDSDSIHDAASFVGLSSAVTGGNDLRIWAGSATPASAAFRVYEDGSMVASKGTIGGWTINTTNITDTAGLVGMSSAVTGGDDIRFWAGNATPASAAFQVTEAGVVTASSINIGGASTIAGWSIDSTRIYKLTTNVGIVLDSSVPVIKVGDTAGTYIAIDGANQRIQSSNYSAGTIGSTWQTSTGNAEFNNVTIRGAIAVTTIQYGYVTAHGGTDWIVPATGVLRDDCTSVNSPTTFAVNVKDPDGISHAAAGAQWAVGDIIRLKEPLTGDLWASISSKTDNTTYWTLNVVKQSPGAGTNYTFRAGLAIIDYGASGEGFIALSADTSMGASPNITMGTHAGSPWTTTSTRARMGNLNGSYGYVADVYGFATGQYGTAGQPSLTVDTTNGIRIISNVTTIGQWDASGNIVVGQVAASQSNVQITSGGVNIRNNTTVLASWDSAGAITVGQVAASQNNILISSGAISIRNNTNERIGITAAGVLTIKDSGGNAVITLDASTGAELTKKLTLSGASSAIAIGSTPPTSATVGTGLWIDRNGVYSLSANTQNATLTSAGLTAAGGNTLINSLGIIMTADVWPSTSRLYWTAADNSAVVGQAIGTYGGAAVNSGLVLYGRAHDGAVRGFVFLGAQTSAGANQATLVVDSNGSATFDFTAVVGAVGSTSLGISTKTSGTNVLNTILYLDTDSSGTAAAGLGSAIGFRTKDSGGNMQSIGFAGVPYVTTTNGSEDSKFVAGFMRKGAFLGLPSSGSYAIHTVNTGNVTTTETDLFTDTLIAGLFAETGDTMIADYAGTTVTHATATRRIRVYFGGTVIFDTTALTTVGGSNWHIRVVCVRSASTTVKCSVTFLGTNYASVVANYQAVTGLTLSNTQIIKITGQAAAAGAATNDIIATFGVLNFYPVQ